MHWVLCQAFYIYHLFWRAKNLVLWIWNQWGETGRAIDFGIPSVVCGSAASVSPRSFSEMQDLRSRPDQLNENVYFNKISRGLVSTPMCPYCCGRPIKKNLSPAVGGFLYCSGSLSGIPEPGVSASPGHLIEMNILESHPRPFEWEALGQQSVLALNVILMKPELFFFFFF